jgi:hypothetical protein
MYLVRKLVKKVKQKAELDFLLGKFTEMGNKYMNEGKCINFWIPPDNLSSTAVVS